jgi:hypothetical protein
MATMMCKLPLSAFIFLILGTAAAQVASHKPTVLAQPAAQGPAASPATSPSDASKPVARVNGTVLTEADLVREEYAIFPYARQHGGLPKEMESDIRGGAMNMIIFEELVYQEAVRRKMTISAARMKEAETDFRKQFATQDEFNALFQSEFHGSGQLLREKIRRSLLIDAFMKAEVETKSVVSEEELKAYYDKNSARFQYPESYTFQTISILPPEKATADQLKEGRKRAEEALRQAKATKTSEEFGMLAEKISDDDFRVMMGQHKPVPVSELAPQVIKAIQAMKPGEVSDLIQLEQAYTIVRLGAHTLAGKKKFEEVKDSLEKELQQNKRNQIRAALDKQLRQGAKVEVL